MSEVITPVIELKEGETHTCAGESFVITEVHTYADIARWAIQHLDADELVDMINFVGGDR